MLRAALLLVAESKGGHNENFEKCGRKHRGQYAGIPLEEVFHFSAPPSSTFRPQTSIISVIYRRAYEHTGISFFFHLCSFLPPSIGRNLSKFSRRFAIVMAIRILEDRLMRKEGGWNSRKNGSSFSWRTWNEIKKGKGIIDPSVYIYIYIKPLLN